MEKSGRVWLPFKLKSKLAARWRDPAYLMRASNKSGCVDFYREKNSASRCVANTRAQPTQPECESPFVQNEYLLMLKWLWILLTHTLCSRQCCDAYRMESGDTHTFTQGHIERSKTKSNQSKCFHVGVLYLHSAHSPTIHDSHSSQFVRMVNFTFIFLPKRFFEFSKLARSMQVIFCWLTLNVVIAAAAADDAKFAIST